MCCFFFFKQKTAYEMRISDWSSDVCSSDLTYSILHRAEADRSTHYYGEQADDYYSRDGGAAMWHGTGAKQLGAVGEVDIKRFHAMLRGEFGKGVVAGRSIRKDSKARAGIDLTISAPKSITLQALVGRSEEHTSELQSLMRNSYAVFCLKKKI